MVKADHWTKSFLSLISESLEKRFASAIEQLKFDLENWVVWLIASTGYKDTKIRPLEFCGNCVTKHLNRYIIFRNNTIKCGHMGTQINMSEEEKSVECGENYL